MEDISLDQLSKKSGVKKQYDKSRNFGKNRDNNSHGYRNQRYQGRHINRDNRYKNKGKFTKNDRFRDQKNDKLIGKGGNFDSRYEKEPRDFWKIERLNIPIGDNNQEKRQNIDLNSEQIQIREDAIHAYGVDYMGTEDIIKFFSSQKAQKVEWLNDSSCNVVFQNKDQVDKVFKELVILQDEIEDRVQQQLNEENQQIEQNGEQDNDDKNMKQVETESSFKSVWYTLKPFYLKGKQIYLQIRRATNKDVKGENITGYNSKYYERYFNALIEKTKKIKKGYGVKMLEKINNILQKKKGSNNNQEGKDSQDQEISEIVDEEMEQNQQEDYDNQDEEDEQFNDENFEEQEDEDEQLQDDDNDLL